MDSSLNEFVAIISKLTDKQLDELLKRAAEIALEKILPKPSSRWWLYWYAA